MAAGLALAALLLFGQRLWPGVFIGAFLVNITTQGSLLTSLALATGNTLEAVAGAWLLHKFAGGTKAFERIHTVFRHLALAALLSTLISATIGVSSLCLAGLARWQQFQPLWLTWWLGDVVSDVVVAPFLIIWLGPYKVRRRRRELIEILALLLVIVVVSQLVFPSALPILGGNNPIGYLVLLPVLFATFRFGTHGAVTAAFISSLLALWGTLHGFGPFVRPEPNQSMLFVQAFIGTITATALALAAVIAEREQARQSLARLAAIVESSDDAIVTQSLEGTITSWNGGAERLFGFLAAEMLGQPILRIVPAEQHPEEIRILERLRRGELIEHYETVRLAKDGRRIDVSLSISLLRDDAGHVTGVSRISRDITARKKAEEALQQSEERFHALADNIPQLAWMTDANGWISWYNQRWYDYTGTTLKEMQGWGWERVHHSDHAQRVVEKWKRHLAGGEYWEDTFPLRAKDGTYGWFLSRAFPIKDSQGRIVHWFGTNTDITDLRAAQEAVSQARAELEQRVEQRTASLTEALSELEAFSYSLSHDMRAPLRAIQSFTTIVLTDHGSNVPPEAHEHLEKVINAARRLDQLIIDVLALARVSRQALKLEPVDVKALIQSLIQERPELQRPRSEVVIEPPLYPVVGHEASLTQCLTNLLGNAVKFVAPGVTPRIRIRAELISANPANVAVPAEGRLENGNEARFVRLWVEDNGIGIDHVSRLRLFRMFERGAHHGEYEGTGMGLAIVRKAAERMGGAVGVESTPGVGSRFWLELRLASQDGS